MRGHRARDHELLVMALGIYNENFSTHNLFILAKYWPLVDRGTFRNICRQWQQISDNISVRWRISAMILKMSARKNDVHLHIYCANLYLEEFYDVATRQSQASFTGHLRRTDIAIFNSATLNSFYFIKESFCQYIYVCRYVDNC